MAFHQLIQPTAYQWRCIYTPSYTTGTKPQNTLSSHLLQERNISPITPLHHTPIIMQWTQQVYSDLEFSISRLYSYISTQLASSTAGAYFISTLFDSSQRRMRSMSLTVYCITQGVLRHA